MQVFQLDLDEFSIVLRQNKINSVVAIIRSVVRTVKSNITAICDLANDFQTVYCNLL